MRVHCGGVRLARGPRARREPAAGPVDVGTSQRLGPPPAAFPPPLPPPPGEKRPFELPPALAPAPSKTFKPPAFAPNATREERAAAVKAAYPKLVPVSATLPEGDPPLSLADLQEMASRASPALRKAEADAEATYGAAVQAGLHPNPTVGYQADQVQPHLNVPPGATFSGKGQQGGYVNQLIKAAGKLRAAQRVAGFDHVNAVVAVRRAQVEVAGQVRQHYFAALSARKALEVGAALAELTDELYRLELGKVTAGLAAVYEPLPLYVQALQARNAVAQARAAYAAAWRQLAAAAGRPDLPMAPLAGRADTPPPAFDPEAARVCMLESNTELLTARNTVEQAKANLTLQQLAPLPDLATNQYHQYDNAAQAYQFGVQVGVALPVFDRNQGGIRQARGHIRSAAESLRVTENGLTARLAEAYGRYEANTAAAANSRDRIIPALTQGYRALVRRYQEEPEKVTFDDIANAQQRLAVALRDYATSLAAQWQAVVDLANLTQQDELILER